MQDFTLHTHTTGFDGANTVEEMVKQAQTMGFRAIGFSNHFIVHPQINNAPMYKYVRLFGYGNIYSRTFEEAVDKFLPHYDNVRKLADKSDIRLLCGMEVDYFNTDEWRRGFEQAVKKLKPDYLIGSAHFVIKDNVPYNTHDIKHASPGDQAKMMAMYWKNIQNVATYGAFDFLAHIDLPRKVGLSSEVFPIWAENEAEAISAIAKNGTKVEINTSPVVVSGQPYPSEKLLKQIGLAKIPVLISDDAHRASHIGRHFNFAEQFARQCGVRQFVTLSDIVHQK